MLATGPVERFERVTLVNNLILNGFQVYRFGGNPSNYPGLTVAKNVRFNTPQLGWGAQFVPALVSGTEQVTSPELNLTGTRSLPYYAFKRVPNHPLVDKGFVIPGLTFSRHAPDIGAYELP